MNGLKSSKLTLIGGKKNFAESLSLWRLRITKSGFERVIITHNYTADIFGRKSLTIHNYTLGNNYTLPDYNFWFFLKDLYTSQKLHDKKEKKDCEDEPKPLSRVISKAMPPSEKGHCTTTERCHFIFLYCFFWHFSFATKLQFLWIFDSFFFVLVFVEIQWKLANYGVITKRILRFPVVPPKVLRKS